MKGTVPALSLLALCSTIVACGGSTPPPAAASDATAAAEPPSASEAAAPAPAPAETDENWEGEAEAKGAADEAKPAPDASVPETRTTEVIAKIVKENRKPFRDCYDKGTKDLPDVKGTMTLHFVLDAEGKVKTAELNQERSTIKAPAVVDCAVAVLKGLKFPPSSRGMESTVNYPFDFKK